MHGVAGAGGSLKEISQNFSRVELKTIFPTLQNLSTFSKFLKHEYVLHSETI